ncbi:pyridoxamine 5'-phosphate oxidase [Granulicella sibirica]|uniref:Pyridoxamine 5'-phosphate oxidase n=1 Tax=Granulicella sibirica TaxID=2479048 RepID=A0A4Q0SZI8_9BACT|nr:pyridoxamine 5'-phosphate oxidase [Granulicella sibirica]RXH54939.1 Pyridoxamine 5'-phosphate oxidase [Granulicella sibirica]
METVEQASSEHPVRIFEPAEASATDPIALFRQWLDAASKTEPNDPNAMAIATSTLSGHPSVRMVLMKRLDERGFSFYTNAESRKGEELEANPNASLCFHWKTQRRQVRIDGPVEMLSPEDSDEYFHSRSRRSQIGAVASNQSHPLASRQHLEREAEALAARFPEIIPRPDYWRGFVVQPSAIEFWQDGPDRLHDRMLYTRTAGGWTRTRLYP